MSATNIRMERLRISVYIIAPILAVLIYSQPVVHERALRRSRYVVYNESDIPDFKSAVKKIREDKKKFENNESKESTGTETQSSLR